MASDPGGEAVLAMDLGGTRLKAGIVAGARVLRYRAAPVSPTDPLDGLLVMGHRLVANTSIARVGLCVPGVLDGSRIAHLPGKLHGAVGVDLDRLLRKEFGCPVIVLNDAIANALGEARHGAGRGFLRVVVVTLGTGVGVGLVEDGHLLGRGRFGGGILGGQIPSPRIPRPQTVVAITAPSKHCAQPDDCWITPRADMHRRMDC